MLPRVLLVAETTRVQLFVTFPCGPVLNIQKEKALTSPIAVGSL